MGTRLYWTRDRILQAVDEWVVATGHYPLSSEWQKPNSPDKPRFPNTQRVIMEFGKWSNMRYFYEKGSWIKGRWTRERALEAALEYNEAMGHPPGAKASRTPGWRGRIPADLTAKNLFGSWNKYLLAAGLQPRPTGVSLKSQNKYKPLPRKEE